MKTQTQPCFKWTGSKQRMLDQYKPLFFPDGKFNRFVDLFCGGLSASLFVYENYPDVSFVLNDANAELIELYQYLKTNSSDVIQCWTSCVSKWLPLSKEERKAFYYLLRDEYVNRHSEHTPYTSGLLLFMLQVNFNGMWKTYKKCNGLYSTPVGTCTQNESFFNVSKIEKVVEFLQHCVIVSDDFENIKVLEGDFVYADPPYRDSIVTYDGSFTEDDQIRLINYLNKVEMFAYSNKNTDDSFYKLHFNTPHIHLMDAKYTAGRGTSVINTTEVLITSYIHSHSSENAKFKPKQDVPTSTKQT